ncbi:IdgA domain protein [Phyllosticta citricarpa]|uniref:IdgA domain protein n=1 Tax=Phyllosticta paracitricarpa TaxID=2016321 RepID=A0ABR1N3A5_9PEZI
MLAMASARSSLRSRMPAWRRGVSVFVKPPKSALSSVLQVSEEVQEALHGRTKKPVVALESAIYTHGFPYPDNIALSSNLESIVRTEGGVPATVGIVDGIARVGMDPEELIRLSQSAGAKNMLKISRRDLANACGTRFLGSGQGKFMGGTTIAGTMVLAHLAGIKVFATGGLGGVHRDGENSLDISADLTELGRTPVAVISSGCKSFLDIGRTLEYLETQGVAVATFADGRIGAVKFPGFWSRDSDSQSPQVVQDARHAAAMIHAQHSMGLTSGLLLANPISVSHEIPLPEISTIIANAVSEATRLGISGAKNTPFILSQIKELTTGRSVAANRALISSNVAVATSVAKELLRLEANESDDVNTAGPEIAAPFGEIASAETKSDQSFMSPVTSESVTARAHSVASNNQAPPGEERDGPATSIVNNVTQDPDGDLHQSNSFGLESNASKVSDETPMSQVDIVVAGAVAVDTACNYQGGNASYPRPALHTSNVSNIRQKIGGVAHNIALAAKYTGKNVRLMSAVGDDMMGRFVLDQMRHEGLDTRDILVKNNGKAVSRTCQYVAINQNDMELHLGMADMSIIENLKDFEILNFLNSLRAQSPKWFLIDANWHYPSLFHLLIAAKDFNPTTGVPGPISTAFEPTSSHKCVRLLMSLANKFRSYIYPRHLVDLATPNELELTRLWSKAQEMELLGSKEHWAVVNSFNLPQGSGSNRLTATTSKELVLEGIPQRTLQLLPLIPTLTVTLGSRGVLLARVLRADDERLSDPEAAPYIIGRTGNIATKNDSDRAREQIGGVYLRLFPPAVHLDKVKSVNGAGDTFTGVLVSALADGKKIEDAIMIAQAGSIMTLKVHDSVSPYLKELIGKDLDEVRLHVGG